jgi:hypothetical protein
MGNCSLNRASLMEPKQQSASVNSFRAFVVASPLLYNSPSISSRPMYGLPGLSNSHAIG